MAGLNFSVTTEGEIALAAAATKTVLQLVAPTNQRVEVMGLSVSFDGVSATQEPIKVDLLRQTTAGTGGSAATPSKDGDYAETIQTTAQKNIATAEPTAGAVLRSWNIHPQFGIDKTFRKGEVQVPGGGRLGLRCTTAGGVAVNVVAEINCEE